MLSIVGLAGTDGLEVLGGDATPNLTSGNLRILQHQGTGSDNGALANLTAVKQGGTHADEGVVVNGAGVDGDIMTNGDVVADMGWTSLVGDVDAATVLNVGAVTNGNGGYVATNDGIEPNGALVAHSNVTDNGGVLTEIALFAPTGGHASITLN